MKHAGTPDKGAVLSFPLSHEAQIITETHVTVLIVTHCEHCFALSLGWAWVP